MNTIFQETKSTEKEEPEYESPYGSRWIIGVADDGTVTVLMSPNVHYSFTDDGVRPENLGFPECVADAPGIYEWICNLEQHVDWESRQVYDWAFYPVEINLLYTWQTDGEVNKSRNEEA